MPTTYETLGVSPSDPNITKLYGERTAKTSCQYFISYVTKTANILDVGCGPGGITADLAKIAKEGRTIGVDISEAVIEQATAAFSDIPNLKFQVADATDLKDFADNSFDIVHCHQVLMHSPDPGPITILKEFYRVCKPGGFIAARENSNSVVLSLKPDLPLLRAYWERCLLFVPKIGGHLQAGRDLEGWAEEAGWGAVGGKIIATKSPASSPGHLLRVTGPAVDQALHWNLGTREELAEWAEAWKEWEDTEGHEWYLEAGEIICWKGK